MADDELAEIRRRRAAELQNQAMDQQAAEDERERARTAVQMALMEILEPEARERLNTIRLTRPEFAANVEQQLIMLARQGRIRQKITDEQLKGLLVQLVRPAGLQYRPQVMKAGVLFSGGKDSALAALLLAPHYRSRGRHLRSDGRNLAAVQGAGAALGLAWRQAPLPDGFSAPPSTGSSPTGTRATRSTSCTAGRSRSSPGSIRSSPTEPGSMTGLPMLGPTKPAP